MAIMNKDAEVRFAISGIRELEFFYKDPYLFLKDVQISEDNISANFELNYKWNLEENKFAVVFKISYSINEENNKHADCLKLSFMNEFQVDNLKDLFQVKENKEFEINEKLEVSLVSITISTARGIVFEKTKGTPLNRFILPIIDPSDVILSKKLNSKQ